MELVRLNLSPAPDYLLLTKLSCISLQYLQPTTRRTLVKRGPSQISDKQKRLDTVLSGFFLSMLHAINFLSYMQRKGGTKTKQIVLQVTVSSLNTIS